MRGCAGSVLVHPRKSAPVRPSSLPAIIPHHAPRPPVRQRVAWWVSVLGHPFVLIPLLVGYVTARVLPPGRAAMVLRLVVAGTVLPMLWIISRRVRSGAWTNYDVSVREQRAGMYPAALVIAGATLLVMVWARAQARPPRHGGIACPHRRGGDIFIAE
jgi:hypothetical protein